MKKVFIILTTILIIIIIIHRNNIEKNEIPMEVPILMYHHFEKDKDKINDMVVEKTEFERQMKYLKDNGYTAITIKELNDFIQGKSILPKKTILITADDGYLSNYEIMYPILKKLNMKATIFVIGKDIDNSSNKNGALPKLTWAKIKEMYDSGLVDIECHTYNSHVKGNTLSGEMGIFSSPLVGETELEYENRIKDDIKKNINTIETHIGYKPIALAYPYGDWSGTSENILKDNGIKISVVASGGKENNVKASYLLKRLCIKGSYNIEDFKKELIK